KGPFSRAAGAPCPPTVSHREFADPDLRGRELQSRRGKGAASLQIPTCEGGNCKLGVGGRRGGTRGPRGRGARGYRSIGRDVRAMASSVPGFRGSFGVLPHV